MYKCPKCNETETMYQEYANVYYHNPDTDDVVGDGNTAFVANDVFICNECDYRSDTRFERMMEVKGSYGTNRNVIQ